MKDTRLYDKALGCLMAGAIGDTLGRPVECWDYPAIVERYGVLDDPFPDWEAQRLKELFGDVGTNNTTLGLILCRAYLKKRGRMGREEYTAAWLDRPRRGAGGATKVRGYPDPRAGAGVARRRSTGRSSTIRFGTSTRASCYCDRR